MQIKLYSEKEWQLSFDVGRISAPQGSKHVVVINNSIISIAMNDNMSAGSVTVWVSHYWKHVYWMQHAGSYMFLIN